MIHAYRFIAELGAAVDLDHPDFQALLDERRAEVQRQIQAFGGDPLPGEAVNIALDREDRAITVVWRSRVGPERSDLLDSIRSIAATFTTVADWHLDHHRCGNAAFRPCGEWSTIMRSDS